jgi:hypothetical protein
MHDIQKNIFFIKSYLFRSRKSNCPFSNGPSESVGNILLSDPYRRQATVSLRHCLPMYVCRCRAGQRLKKFFGCRDDRVTRLAETGRFYNQGCQMVYFQTQIQCLGKFLMVLKWKLLEYIMSFTATLFITLDTLRKASWVVLNARLFFHRKFY